MFSFSLKKALTDWLIDWMVISLRLQLFNSQTITTAAIVSSSSPVVCFHLSGINTFPLTYPAPISFWKHTQSCWALQFHSAMTQRQHWIVLTCSQWARSSRGSVSTGGRRVPVFSWTPAGVGGQKEFSNPSPLYQLSIKINVRVKRCLHMRAIKFQITVHERVQTKKWMTLKISR